MVHPSMHPIHKIYEQSGFNLGNWMPFSRRNFKANLNHIFITSPQSLTAYVRNPKYYTAFATGWKHVHRHHSFSLLISDHIDWKQLHELIEKVNPSYILTTHGNGAELKNYFSGNLFSTIKFLN
jgi:putative mRNA 3-end processing factor